MKKIYIDIVFALAAISYIYTLTTLAEKWFKSGNIGLWIAFITLGIALYLNEKKD